jgi:poly-gamma-glutamate synthesis protein (capsule biosynthesis protein)
MKKILILIFFIVIVVLGFFILKNSRNFDFENQDSAELIQPEIQKLSILAFGDMMLDRTVYAKTQKAVDFNYPFFNIDSLLRTGDLKIANLEGPITKYQSVSNGKSRMRFTISPNFLEILKNRFDVVSLANNHMLDFGESGYGQAKELLASAGIDFFGDYKNRAENLSTIVEKNKIKIGFVGYHDLIDEGIDGVIAEIKKIRNESDFVIVMPHWGNEYQKTSSKRQQEEARKFIDAGADLILGGHPHVVQESEEYNGKMIFYSLGNFIFDQYFSQDTMEGLGVEILLEKRDNRVVATYKQHKILINENSQPGLID